jgi:CPA2 family monovalent cation:H+ antiporter-2
MTAGIAVLIFKKLKQPLVLGYLRFSAGTHFDFFPSVTDVKSVEVWAEIGVIFIQFGLEFSFREDEVKGTASINAMTQIITMVIVIIWTMDGLAPNGQYFLGVILYIIHHNYSEDLRTN